MEKLDFSMEKLEKEPKSVKEIYEAALSIYNKYNGRRDLMPTEFLEYDWATRVLDYIESVSSRDMIKEIAEGNAGKFVQNIKEANAQIDTKIMELQKKIDSLNVDYSKLSSMVSSNEREKDESRIEYIESLRKSMSELKKIIDDLIEGIKELQNLKENNIKLSASFYSDSEGFVNDIVKNNISNPENYLKDIVKDIKRYDGSSSYDIMLNPAKPESFSYSDVPHIIDENGNINRPLLEIALDYATGRQSKNLHNIYRINSCKSKMYDVEDDKDRFNNLKNYILKYLDIHSECYKAKQDAEMLSKTDKVFHKKYYWDTMDKYHCLKDEENETKKNLEIKISNAIKYFGWLGYYGKAKELLSELGVELQSISNDDERKLLLTTFVNLLSESPEKYDEFIGKFTSILDDTYSELKKEKERCINELPDEYKEITPAWIGRLDYYYGCRRYWNYETVWDNNVSDEDAPSHEKYIWLYYREAIRKLYILAVLDDFNKSKEKNKNDILGSDYKQYIVDSFSDAMEEKISKPITM